MKEPVVDTNNLLPALIQDSKTRSLIVNLDHQLVAPEAIYNEIKNYRGLIREKSGLHREQLDNLINTLFKYIQIVPTADIDPFLDTAKEQLGEIDQDDVIFLATALAVDGSIWSDDKHFQQQKLVNAYTTPEIIDQTS